MKITCGVIRDLLPLYSEKMTGEESNVLVREHLDECEDCSDYLKKLQNPIDNDGRATLYSNDNSLKLVRKGIRSRKATAVWFSVLLVFMVMLTVFSHLVKPEYISYRDSGINVIELDGGPVCAQFSDKVTSVKLIRSVNEDNRTVVEITAWTSQWDRIFGITTKFAALSFPGLIEADIAYYCDFSSKDENMTVIYGTDAEENNIVLPRLVLGYYFIAALISAVVIGLVYVIFKKNKKVSLICGYLFAAPLSYMLGHLIITTRFVSFSATYDFIMNCIAALAIYGILILGAFLLRQHKKDIIT